MTARSSVDAHWWIVGVPIDSSGADRAEARAPEALRAAGLLEALPIPDEGDLAVTIDDPARDEPTGVIGFEQVRRGSETIRAAIGELLAAGARPLVLGGDCTLLIGVFAALRDRLGRTGLWFVDGHADFYDGHSSPSGEAADMELAVLTGHAMPELGLGRLIDPGDVIVAGHRRPTDADGPEELDRVDPGVQMIDAPSVSASGPARVGREIERTIAERVGAGWLHLDLDVLDAGSLPAVSYPQPGGLDWVELRELVRPLVASGAIVGMSVADYNPDLDEGGDGGRSVVELLADLLEAA